jgi:hypothetical protein
MVKGANPLKLSKKKGNISNITATILAENQVKRDKNKKHP